MIEGMNRRILSKFGIGIFIIPKKDTKTVNPIEHNSLDGMNKFYSDPDLVKISVNHERLLFYNSVIDLLIDNGVNFDSKSIVDVGCGTGHLLKTIYDKFDNVNLMGLDYSDSALKIAKKTCPIADLYQFNIYDGYPQKFDIVLCTEVLEHLLYPEKALETCLETVADDGVLLVTVPNGRKDTYLGHINFWSPESWKVFIETNCKNFNIEFGIIENGLTNYAIIRN
jgi:2-polyprenyl-3-methyl-5-hydroxy-6-metoxy-1,4-benzoquinol methylase